MKDIGVLLFMGIILLAGVVGYLAFGLVLYCIMTCF